MAHTEFTMEISKPTKKCAECGSIFYIHSSKMKSLCPECSHYLYGYNKCDHEMKNGRCKLCYWDGSVSDYIQFIKKGFQKQ